jgi:hypothetical protein
MAPTLEELRINSLSILQEQEVGRIGVIYYPRDSRRAAGQSLRGVNVTKNHLEIT